MKPDEARKMFEPALRDELGTRKQNAFKAALIDDPALADEFEDYADRGGDVRNVNAWLHDAGRNANGPDDGVYAALTARIIHQATTRQRGRLIRLVAAVGGLAAAAAIVAVVFIQPDSGSGDAVQPSPTSYAGPGQHNAEEKPEHEEKPAKPEKEDEPEERGAEHFKRIDLNGDGKLTADEVPQFMLDDWDDDKSGDLSSEEFTKHHKGPQPIKAEDEFARLDANSDGVLDRDEARPPMLRDFDDDSSGDISKQEFTKYWKPRLPRPEEEFKRLDRNDDGSLDAQEVPKRMVQDWDADGNGSVTLEEFRTNFKPPREHRRGPGEGPRNPPPREGPEGDRPPRGGDEPPREGDAPPPRRDGPPPRRGEGGERPPRRDEPPPRD